MENRSRSYSLVLIALGSLAIIIGIWVYVEDVNNWSIIFALTGVLLIVPATLSYYERTRGKLAYPVLIFSLCLPGCVIVGTIVVLSEMGHFLFFPGTSGGGQELLWYVPVFVIPLSYALGRAKKRSQQWLIASPVILLTIFSIAYTVGQQGTNYALSVSLVTFVIALSTWAGIPLYRVGEGIRNTGPSSPIFRHPPAIVAGVLCSAILFGFIYLWNDLFPVESGTFLYVVVFGVPLLYFAVRGIQHLEIARG